MQRYTRTAFCAFMLALHVHGAWAESGVDAVAQVQSADKRSKVSQPLDPQTTVSETAYESAFKGYRPYQEDEVRSWPSANEEVGRIGGWKAYAREAMQGNVAGAVPTPPDETTDHQMK